uniref:Uncharacterized protein n=1 Tax=Peronospora matthiolae TaxID=2874970 RepID=A0AAV1TMG6_9STRA
MNWMTGGKHRALYSQRGQRRQMHFPSQVQRQRVKPSSPSRSAQPAAAARARDSTTPWYIVQVGDDTESQDIRVLELERQRAKSSKPATSQEVTGETAALEVTSDWTLDSRARLSPSHKTRRGQDAVEGRDGSSGSRCVFTPVKKARRGERPFRAVQRLPDASGGERPLSTVASGGDTVFVNDGEELRHETQAQHTERECARRFPFETHDGRFSQHIGQNDDQNVRQVFLSQHLMELVLMSKYCCPRSFSSIIVNLVWTKTTTQKQPSTVECLRFSSKHLTAYTASNKPSLTK